MTTRVVNAEPQKDERALTTRSTNRQEVATQQPDTGALSELTIEELVARHTKIKRAINEVLTPGVDFGIIPGTSRKNPETGEEMAKPSLYKSGAEKISTLFLFDPEFDNVQTFDGDHMTVTSTCILYHIPTEHRVGSGSGMCSTKESKYAYRIANLKCPKCGKEAIIKGREEYGGGWVCFEKKGGCKAKFQDDDESITKQARGQVPNDKIPDSWNTVLKMGEKRSHVAAIIRATGASEFVTQDLEDMDEEALNSIIRRGEQILAARQEGGDAKKTSGDTGKGQKTSQQGSNTSKKASSKAQENGKGGAADRISADDVKEIELICLILETEPDDILNYYRNSSEEAKKNVKTFADFTPGMLANLRMQAEKQAKKENKDLKTALAEAKAKSDEGAPA